jgi:WD40 repeat protein
MLGTGEGCRRFAIGLGVLLIVLVAAAPADAAFDCGSTMKTCQTQVDNSGRVWFWTTEPLTEDALGDGTPRGGVLQVYERDGATTTLLHGPDGKPIPYGERHRYSEYVNGVSPDGERVYISTEASLTPDDHDVPFAGDWTVDGYELRDGRFTLLTTGSLDESLPNDFGCCGAQIVWASDDGSQVYFVTNDRMTADDHDESRDIYERAGGRTRLVSTSPEEVLPDPNYGERAPDAEFLGASTDGATAYFSTLQRLTADDTEKWTADIYSWRDGATRRITHTIRYPEGPGQPFESFFPMNFGGASDDGSIFYEAYSPQSADDTDANGDLYRTRADGTTERLVLGSPPPSSPGMYLNPLTPGAVSQDGKRLYFTTTRALLPADTDDEADVYLLLTESGQLRLVSEGRADEPAEDPELTFSGTSRDGRRAFFSTWERLTPEDTDEEVDVYEWVDGHDRLATPSAEGRQVGSFFDSISPNGRYIAFSTFEELVPGDGDLNSDIYLVDMGPQPQPEGRASASAARPGRTGRHRPHRRLRLVSAESIAPKMKIAARGTFGDGGVHLRLGCPKAETSGPCHGRAKLLSRAGKVLASGSFRIGAGRHALVELDGRNLPRRGSLSVIARVRGADMLHNAARVHATVELRHTP